MRILEGSETVGNGVHDELIRKKDALDALMAERKRLLANGQKGAEHVLTHHGYNVIDELQPVQSDVPDINDGELISRRAALDAIHEDAEWLAAQGSDWQVARMERDKSILKSLPAVQTEITHEQAIDYLNKTGWMQTHDKILTESKADAKAEAIPLAWIKGYIVTCDLFDLRVIVPASKVIKTMVKIWEQENPRAKEGEQHETD